MSSDDSIDDYHRSNSSNNKSHYHQQLSPKKPHHQQLSIHNENSLIQSNHSIASASTQTINCCDLSGVNNGGTIKRRKSTASATSNTNSTVAAATSTGNLITDKIARATFFNLYQYYFRSSFKR